MRNNLTRFILFSLLSLSVCSVNAQQIIRTLAGTGTFGNGFDGDNGPAIQANLGGLFGVVVDTAGNIYFSDQYNYVIRRINKNGIVKTIAGTGFPGYSGNGGPASAARLGVVQPLVMDQAGNLYVGDAGNKVVRKISTTGIISTIAGDPSILTYGTGDGGPATNAGLGSVSGLAFDASGNLYIADGNTRIRKVTSAGIISTVAGGTIGYSGNGGPATAAAFDGLSDVTFDMNNNMYVVDRNNQVIRKITPAGIVSLFAGTQGSAAFSGDGGPATSCRLSYPICIRFDTSGNLFIADQSNNRIRKINTSGIISTICGSVNGFAGDGGPATAARLSAPNGICFDTRQNLYIIDKGTGTPGGQPWGRRVRQIFHTDTFPLSVSPSAVLCGNTFAIFTAHPRYAYYNYKYEWRRNGVIVGTNSLTYTNTAVHNNDTMTCSIIDTSFGGLSLAQSDTIIMTVLPPHLPEVHVTSTGDTVCAGLSVTFTATSVNGGPSPIYKWYVFNTLRGTGPTFTYIPVTGDIVSCVLVSDDPCAYPDTARVEIPMSTIPSFLPVVIINASPDTVITHWSEIITLFSNVTYGGDSPTYQWYNGHGPIAGATSSSYFQEIYGPDTFYCVMHSNAYCAVPEIDTSNIIYIGVGKLGVDEHASTLSAFGIYPNPNNGHFTLKGVINHSNNDAIHVEIRNALGRSFYDMDLTGRTGNIELPVTLQETTPPGLYFLVIYDGNGKRAIPFTVN